MLADHLTPVEPEQVVNAVLAVLAGAEPQASAAAIGMAPSDLDDAVQTFQAAGRAALERRAEREWYEVRIRFPDWNTAETAVATRLGPRLNRLQSDGGCTGWWFLRKHPCWRLRLRGARTTAVDQILSDLTEAGVIAGWWPTTYEPEIAAFGGTSGMHAVHDLFCADTRGVLAYARHPSPRLGRRELSILLLSGLLDAAGLDRFERGDVFDRVAGLRPAPTTADTARLQHLADRVRTLLSIPDLTGSALFSPSGPAAHAAPWLAECRTAGRKLGDAASGGQLDRGIRAILTHIVIFHWNRLGLSATSQGILSRAATTALLPRS